MSRRNELMRRLLSGLTDSELENLVRVREEARLIAVRGTPIPKPGRNVQQLIQHFENNPIHNIDRFHSPEQRNSSQ